MLSLMLNTLDANISSISSLNGSIVEPVQSNSSSDKKLRHCLIGLTNCRIRKVPLHLKEIESEFCAYLDFIF